MATIDGGVPQWKTLLLEKKRRQEDTKRRMSEDEQRLSNMPDWKIKILKKKKNSRVFLASESEKSHPDLARRDSGSSMESPRSAASNSTGCSEHDHDLMLNHHATTNNVDATGKSAEPEHLLPVQQNPWLVTDPGRYKSSRGSSGPTSPRLVSNSSGTSISYDKQQSHQSDTDEVFQNSEETFEYGQGFVNKLLKRFTTLTSNEDNQLPKRSHSADNLLDEGARSSTLPRSRSTTDRSNFMSASQFPSRHSYSTLPAPTKSHSVDNLIDSGDYNRTMLPNGDCIDGASFSDTHYNTDSGSSPCMSPRSVDTTNESIVLDELPRPNTVSSTRSIFETASSKSNTLFSSLKKSKSHDVGLGSGTYSSANHHRSPSPVVSGLINGDAEHDANDNISTGSTGNGVISHSKSEDNMLHVNNETGPGVTKIQSTEESIKNIRLHGRSWYFSEHGSTEVKVNRFTNGDSNSNFADNNAHRSHGTEPSTYSSSVEDSYNSSIKHNNEINNRINASDHNGQSYQIGSSTSYNTASRMNGDYNPKTDRQLHLDLSKLDSSGDELRDELSHDTNSASVHHGTAYQESKQDYQSSSANVNSTSSMKAVRPSSLPHNHREEVPREGDSVSTTKVKPVSKSKPPSKPAPPRSTGSSGPGSLTIRPASNIVPASSVPYLDINSYDDVHTGVFKPARKTGQSRVYTNSGDDVPVTNIDDIPDDVPVTYIDDVSPSKSPSRSELDADRQRKATSSQYEFIGSGVTFGKSLLNKSGRGKKVRHSSSITYEFALNISQKLCYTIFNLYHHKVYSL